MRYYGHYASAARAKRRKWIEEATTLESSETARKEALPCSAERRRLRRGGAQLIRRVYEVDPLLCPCGEMMRILSFLTDPPVVRRILRHLESSASSVREVRRGWDPSPRLSLRDVRDRVDFVLGEVRLGS